MKTKNFSSNKKNSYKLLALGVITAVAGISKGFGQNISGAISGAVQQLKEPTVPEFNPKTVSLDISAKDEFALMAAVGEDNLEALKAILTHPEVDINAKYWRGRTALIEASLYGNTEVVKALLSHHELDINATDEMGLTALMTAADRGETDVVLALLDHKDKDGAYTVSQDEVLEAVNRVKEESPDLAGMIRGYINT